MRSGADPQPEEPLTLDGRIEQLRSAAWLSLGADGRGGRHESVWHPLGGEFGTNWLLRDLVGGAGWLLSDPVGRDRLGWVSLPGRDWTSIAVTANAAWHLGPNPHSRAGVYALTRSLSTVAEWDSWWRFRQHGTLGTRALRMRTSLSPLSTVWLLSDEHARVARITATDDAPGFPHHSRRPGFGRLRFDWEEPQDSPLLALLVTYVLTLRRVSQWIVVSG